MWDKVKPITLSLKQKNNDNTTFVLDFYSFDSELVKLNEAFLYDMNLKLIGTYSRLNKTEGNCNYNSNFFICKLSKNTIKKIIKYFENPNLFIEFMI